jgi:uncharacterized protein (TIGR02145 family)
MNCPKCNASLADDAKFCTECGMKIETQAQTPKAEPELKSSKPDKTKNLPKKPLMIGGVVALVVAVTLIFFSESSKPSIKIITIDGQDFKTVKIGNQVWMAENLNLMPKTGKSWCYDNDPENCEKYGKLYDWEAATSVCPEGWQLPSNKEWEVLVNFAGGRKAAGNKLKSKKGWAQNGNGTDEFGFSAFPGGSRDSKGNFFGISGYAYWWNSTELNDLESYTQYMYRHIATVDQSTDIKSIGGGVRCIQDDDVISSTQKISDQEAAIANGPPSIKSVKIGDQVWMAENLNLMPPKGNSWCYGNNPKNCEKYGRLYDWEAAMSVCPEGWHLPSDDEWETLSNVVGGSNIAGNKLKSKKGWAKDSNGTDEFGFSALPGGNYIEPSFHWQVLTGFWWSSTDDISIAVDIDGSMHNGSSSKRSGFSVRCVKD